MKIKILFTEDKFKIKAARINKVNIDKLNIRLELFFLKTPINPINGMIGIPSEPGLGMEIDSSKIESEKVIK